MTGSNSSSMGPPHAALRVTGFRASVCLPRLLINQINGIHQSIYLGEELLFFEVPNLRRPRGAYRRTAPASLADRFIDHRDIPAVVKLDCGIRAQGKTHLTAGTQVRIDIRNGRGDLHGPPGGKRESLGSGSRGLGDAIGDILRPLAGP